MVDDAPTTPTPLDSVPPSVGGYVRYRVNANHGSLRHGEVIEIRPDEWVDEIEAGLLCPDDENAKQQGEGDDGPTSGGDTGRTPEGQTSDTAAPGDGADGHDVGRSGPEPSPKDR